MDAADPSIDALLTAVRAQFAASLPAKVAEIDGFIAGREWDEARRAAHKLRGSAATYGFAELGQAAAAIEDALLDGVEPADDARSRIAERLVEARAEAARAAAESP
jgi:HPt (histidine-containing phosphotransfer) domain-containing protein